MLSPSPFRDDDDASNDAEGQLGQQHIELLVLGKAEDEGLDVPTEPVEDDDVDSLADEYRGLLLGEQQDRKHTTSKRGSSSGSPTNSSIHSHCPWLLRHKALLASFLVAAVFLMVLYFVDEDIVPVDVQGIDYDKQVVVKANVTTATTTQTSTVPPPPTKEETISDGASTSQNPLQPKHWMGILNSSETIHAMFVEATTKIALENGMVTVTDSDEFQPSSSSSCEPLLYNLTKQGCRREYNGFGGIGNRILAFADARWKAFAQGNTSLLYDCGKDAFEERRDLVVPWLSGYLPARYVFEKMSSRQGDGSSHLLQVEATPADPSNDHRNCPAENGTAPPKNKHARQRHRQLNPGNQSPLKFLNPWMSIDLRRLAVAAVGVPSPEHPSAKFFKEILLPMEGETHLVGISLVTTRRPLLELES